MDLAWIGAEPTSRLFSSTLTVIVISYYVAAAELLPSAM
jgi:hypothetical protein